MRRMRGTTRRPSRTEIDKTSKKWVSEKEISVMTIAEDARDYICSRPSVVNSAISVSKVHSLIPAERRARSELLRMGSTLAYPRGTVKTTIAN